jgi:serine/threonine protein kinase
MEGEICSSVHLLFHDAHPNFTEAEAKYCMASMMDAISSAHLHNIIYRSVAPEFISLDRNGRIKLHHLELAKQTKYMERTRTRCGMPEFMAPEQILGSGHGPAVDLWALGVLAYDLLCGCTPFAPDHESELMVIYENILAHDSRHALQYPQSVKMSEAQDEFISKLLNPDPAKRLGSNLEANTEEEMGTLRSQAWFKGFDWKALQEETMPSPLKPLIEVAMAASEDFVAETFQI